MGKSLSLKIIMALAVTQAIAGLLRAFNWVDVGVDLFGQGVLLLPFIGLIAVMRGLLIAVVALLYGLFVVGAFLGQSWTRWIGLVAAIVSLILVVAVLTQGGPAAPAIAWAVIPVLLIVYLFSSTGRASLKDAD